MTKLWINPETLRLIEIRKDETGDAGHLHVPGIAVYLPGVPWFDNKAIMKNIGTAYVFEHNVYTDYQSDELKLHGDVVVGSIKVDKAQHPDTKEVAAGQLERINNYLMYGSWDAYLYNDYDDYDLESVEDTVAISNPEDDLSEQFDEVLARMRPDETGWVRVVDLDDDTAVRIAGQILATTTPGSRKLALLKSFLDRL